jgi:hypothetical protein
LANEAKNTAEVIGKDRTSKPRAVDEMRCVEDVLVLNGNLPLALGIVRGDIIWVLVGGALVNLKQFVGNVLNMNYQRAREWR